MADQDQLRHRAAPFMGNGVKQFGALTTHAPSAKRHLRIAPSHIVVAFLQRSGFFRIFPSIALDLIRQLNDKRVRATRSFVACYHAGNSEKLGPTWERKMQYKTLGLSALLGSTILATPAFAQDQDNSEDQARSNIIVVTATRREENLQEIPLAVTSVSSEALDRQGVTSIRSLSAVSSSFNLNSSDTEAGGTTLRIRGVGTTGNNIGLESAVGVFLDGVYLSRPGIALGDLVDLERVEVLRGPQGTLFGRNTSAGALNIITKKPNLTEFEGFANASYGNFDLINVQGGVSAPLVADTLGVRLSGAYRQRDGFLTDPDGRDLNDSQVLTFRGQLYWEPSPDVNIRIIGDYGDSESACCSAVVLREAEIFASGAAFLGQGLPANGGAPFIGFDDLEARRVNQTSDLEETIESWGISGELNWDIGDAATLTYLASYRDFRSTSSRSTDFVDLAIFSVGSGDSIFDGGGPNEGSIVTWTQELRLTGEAFDGKLEWLVGGYYSNEEIRTQRGVLGLGPQYEAFVNAFISAAAPGTPSLDTLGFIATGGLLGNPNAVRNLNFSGSFADNRFSQDAEAWSIFTHNTFEIVDGLKFNFGLRYTDDKKEGAFEQAAAQSNACLTLLPVLGRSPLNGLTCFVFAVQADSPLAFDNPATAAPGDGFALPRTFGNGAQGGAFDDFSDDELIYTAKLLWEPSPDVNTYASFTHGYKTGGFNLDASASVLGADPRFDSETIDAYEIGLKATVLGGRGTINIAAFHQELQDFQVLEFTGVAFTTFNVPSAKSTGFEAEFSGQLSDQFSTNVAITYADARYPDNCDEGIPAPIPAQVSNLCGAPLTNAPEFVGNFGLVYENEITDSGWKVTASGNLRYETERRTSTQPTVLGTDTPLPFDIQEANFKVNARLGFSAPNDIFTIEFWGVNIFDEQTRNVTFNTPLRSTSRSAFLEDPRTYGVTVRTQF
jgi:outer membrane receptor protein involved in Fe transport